MRHATYLAAPILVIIAGCGESTAPPNRDPTPGVESSSGAPQSQRAAPRTVQSAAKSIPDDVTYTIKRKTEGKRLRRSMQAIWSWCRESRHRPIEDQYRILSAKLRGHYQYYGVRCNGQCLDLVYYTAVRAWPYWLNRRGGRKLTWQALLSLS